MEVLLYFFFQVLANPDQLNSFMFCWPPRTPEQRREFKEEAYQLLLRLQEEGKIPPNSVLGKSVLDIAQGERLLLLLKVLSESSMRHRLAQEMPWQQVPNFPTADQYISNPSLVSRNSIQRIKKAMVIQIHQQIQAFNTRAKHMVQSQKTWLAHAQELVQMHKKLRDELDALKKEAASAENGTELIDRIAAVDRIPQIDMTRYIWRNLAAIDEESQDLKGEYAIEKICKMDSERRQIDSVGTPPSFSELLEETTPDSSRETQEGRHKLHRTVAHWTNELKAMAEMFQKKHQEQLQFSKGKQTKMLSVTDHLSGVVERAEAQHRTQVSHLREMNAKLQDEIGRVKLSIATHQYRDKQDPNRD